MTSTPAPHGPELHIDPSRPVRVIGADTSDADALQLMRVTASATSPSSPTAGELLRPGHLARGQRGPGVPLLVWPW